eukprot:scaffold2740_cov418-Prasinococcus_capsulatus_cf.AAC.22
MPRHWCPRGRLLMRLPGLLRKPARAALFCGYGICLAPGRPLRRRRQDRATSNELHTLRSDGASVGGRSRAYRRQRHVGHFLVVPRGGMSSAGGGAQPGVRGPARTGVAEPAGPTTWERSFSQSRGLRLQLSWHQLD